jgi:hypothetical protein
VLGRRFQARGDRVLQKVSRFRLTDRAMTVQRKQALLRLSALARLERPGLA